MSRMTKKNLRNIKTIFEEKTGTELETANHWFPARKLVVLAAILISCFVLAAFAYPLFTPLEGDELVLSGSYEGNGIVSVYVENHSGKTLEFQKQLKLMCWSTSEEVHSLGGEVRFYNTKFPAHTSGVMTVDLSEAYEIGTLKAGEWYYLLLTNNSFLFGHDWMCSVDFE